ncbi:unnamed protein product, partial [Phaeothamnion confervicola]
WNASAPALETALRALMPLQEVRFGGDGESGAWTVMFPETAGPQPLLTSPCQAGAPATELCLLTTTVGDDDTIGGAGSLTVERVVLGSTPLMGDFTLLLNDDEAASGTGNGNADGGRWKEMSWLPA